MGRRKKIWHPTRKTVQVAVMFAAVGLAFMLLWPIVGGCISIIHGITQTMPPKDIIPSPIPSASFQLAILATALGGITLWFASRPRPDISPLRDSADQWQIRGITVIGRSFLFSAACFAILGLLSPLVPGTVGKIDFWTQFIKLAFIASLISGSVFLTIALSFLVFEIWFWK